jgi:hypothetical protein
MVFGFMAAGERENMMDAVDQAILRRLQRDGYISLHPADVR